jgi:hypothetical protein
LGIRQPSCGELLGRYYNINIMTPVPIPPRNLSDAERDVLMFMLSADFVGANELRAQIPDCQVTAVWVDGLPSVDLAVPDGADKAPVADGETPAGSEVRDSAGKYLGEVLIWVTDGCLSAIEYAWVTDDPPAELPAVTNLTLV